VLSERFLHSLYFRRHCSYFGEFRQGDTVGYKGWVVRRQAGVVEGIRIDWAD
jgi:hypothetical protein